MLSREQSKEMRYIAREMKSEKRIISHNCRRQKEASDRTDIAARIL
jgi:hypothetical protein